MSHSPSPSMSPRATPEPVSRLRFVTERSSRTRLVNQIPVLSVGISVNPFLPIVGTGRAAQRHPGAACHLSPVGSAALESSANEPDNQHVASADETTLRIGFIYLRTSTSPVRCKRTS